MLRSALLGFACLLTIVGVFRVSAGDMGAWPLVIWGLVLSLAVVLERWRYRQHDELHADPHGEADSGEWQQTEERFVDPETGQLMRVYYQPATGKRRYVQVGNHADRK